VSCLEIYFEQALALSHGRNRSMVFVATAQRQCIATEL